MSRHVRRSAVPTLREWTDGFHYGTIDRRGQHWKQDRQRQLSDVFAKEYSHALAITSQTPPAFANIHPQSETDERTNEGADFIRPVIRQKNQLLRLVYLDARQGFEP